MNEVFQNFGLKINVSKTETMILNHQEITPEEYPESIISLEGCALKNVKEFRYLGANLHHDDPSTGDAELNHRISMENCKFAEMSNLL